VTTAVRVSADASGSVCAATPATATAQVSGEMYLPRSDPTHGMNHEPRARTRRGAERLVPRAAPIAPPRR
jgi:hypothetical protein